MDMPRHQINQQHPTSKQPVLSIIALPIGNPQDITLRALERLKEVEVIACEDTRVTSRLLRHYDIQTPCICYHDHSGEKERRKIFHILAEGKSVALVSDAGTPLISDPGYKLVREAYEQDYAVETLPGASSLTAALTVAGLPTNRFSFEGFPPNKPVARRKYYEKLKAYDGTLVFFESPVRLVDSLGDMQDIFADREVAVVRELTKTYEEVKRGTPGEVLAFYQSEEAFCKGEIVIVVGPPAEHPVDDAYLDQALKDAMKTMRLKEAVAWVVEHTGLSKKLVYQRALELKGD